VGGRIGSAEGEQYMNGTNVWLNGWKALAEYRRQNLAQALSTKPLNPATRALYVKVAQSLNDDRVNWLDAQIADAKHRNQILAKASNGTPTSPKGSLGEDN
jgi:hypothetical protein